MSSSTPAWRVLVARHAQKSVARAPEQERERLRVALEQMEGFCSASLLVDRGSGRAVSSATYDSVEAMQRNRDQGDKLRAAGTQEAGAEVLDDREFELAIAHLRVPEMA